MSEPRIAVVAEGPTDFVLIVAALRAILPRPFVPTLLQPEPTRPQLGSGWGGVLKWCTELRSRRVSRLDADATLSGYDMVVLQLDADVAHKSYADFGEAAAAACADLPTLPCHRPCPPVGDTVGALQSVLLGWLGMPGGLGPRAALCIPSKAIESWLAAAVFSTDPRMLADLECSLSMEARLASRPKGSKIRKSVQQYRLHADAVRTGWPGVVQRCSQAQAFDAAVRAVATSNPALQ